MGAAVSVLLALSCGLEKQMEGSLIQMPEIHGHFLSFKIKIRSLILGPKLADGGVFNSDAINLWPLSVL